MGIELKRLGPHSINLVIMHGRIDRNALIGFWQSIDPEDPANTMPWVITLLLDADMSDVDIAAYVELKRVLARIRDKAAEKKSYTSVVISHSEHCDTLIEFWHDFVSKDTKYPPHNILFSNINSACESLKLPDSAEMAIVDAIRSHSAPREASESSRPSDDRP